MGMLMAMTQMKQKTEKDEKKVVKEIPAPVKEPKEEPVKEEPVKRTGRRKTK